MGCGKRLLSAHKKIVVNLMPYIMFDGDTEEALNLYAECLNGDIPYLGRYRDSPMKIPKNQKNQIMHATIWFEGSTIMVSDRAERVEYAPGGTESNIRMSLTVPLYDIHAVYDAISAGGNQTMSLKKQFWGDTFGMLTDKFGVHGMLSGEEGKDEASE